MIRFLLISVLLNLCVLSFTQVFDAELILHTKNIEIEGNEMTEDVYFKIKINNRNGDKYTEISIPNSQLVRTSKIEASLKDANGKLIKKLRRGDITERSSISDYSFFEDDFVKEFTLKHNTYPYTIEYSFRTQLNEFVHIDDWYPLIDTEIPTRKARLSVSVPLNYKIAYKNQFIDAPEIDTVENVVHYHWNGCYTDIIEQEEFSPPILSYLPAVKIIPINFYFDKTGSFKDWISFGNWQYKLLQGLNELPEKEIVKIQSLISDIEEDKEKIRKLYHYLQDETRYINVTIETGGLKPYPAAYVAQNKYGDCKALTNYFKTLLEYVHIPSYYAKVNAGSPILDIDKDFPSQQSNHIILFVPLEGEDIWLDCTSDGSFNYLGTFTQGRYAFLIKKDSSRFIKTPSLEPRDVLETRKICVSYGVERASVNFINTCRGEVFEVISSLNTHYSNSEKAIIIRNYFLEEGHQLKDYQLLYPGRDSLWMILSVNTSSQNVYKNYGNDLLIGNIAFSLPKFEKPKERKLPVQIDYPIYKIDTIVYKIPQGYKLLEDSINYSVDSNYGEYRLTSYLDNENIITIKRLLINAGRFPVSSYEDFYNFYQQVLYFENKTHLILSKENYE